MTSEESISQVAPTATMAKARPAIMLHRTGFMPSTALSTPAQEKYGQLIEGFIKEFSEVVDRAVAEIKALMVDRRFSIDFKMEKRAEIIARELAALQKVVDTHDPKIFNDFQAAKDAIKASPPAPADFDAVASQREIRGYLRSIPASERLEYLGAAARAGQTAVISATFYDPAPGSILARNADMDKVVSQWIQIAFAQQIQNLAVVSEARSLFEGNLLTAVNAIKNAKAGA